MNAPLTVAISPCPNDTFIFGAWVQGLIPDCLGRPVRFVWADVEELNNAAEQGRFDVLKLSAAAALDLEDSYEILSAGAAFGVGAGPKLLVRPDSPRQLRTIAVPGLKTTAFAVLRAALGHDFSPVPMLFSDIVDAVSQGQTDAGLVIHETALVHDRYGLELRLDLGAWWAEHGAGTPMPLGVIAARRSLPEDLRRAVTQTIRASLEHAHRHRASIWPLIHSLAQELDNDTLCAHIEAYVTEMSLKMGPRGVLALDRLRAITQNP
ncbi:MAG: 1,4-dihydroxy-6-naphthoate synthase [Proteobacteria bacterium]|nr:1,4-dihydroxy-6-naphthoate synthase [Pseudomonadota bacterium]